MELLAGLGAGQTQDEHVFCHPAIAASHGRSNTESKALLAEQGVATVAGAEGPDFVGLGEVRDVLFVVARPVVINLALFERNAHGVNGGNPGCTFSDEVHCSRAHAGHDAHVADNVGGVGDLDAELRDRTAQRAHGEGDHVHRAALHGAGELLLEDGLHFGRVCPVVGRAGVLFLFGADERTGLDACNVRGLGASKEGVRALLFVELGEHASLNHERGQAIPLFLRTIGELDGVRRRQRGDLSNPCENVFWSVGRSCCSHILFSHGHFASCGFRYSRATGAPLFYVFHNPR